MSLCFLPNRGEEKLMAKKADGNGDRQRPLHLAACQMMIPRMTSTMDSTMARMHIFLRDFCCREKKQTRELSIKLFLRWGLGALWQSFLDYSTCIIRGFRPKLQSFPNLTHLSLTLTLCLSSLSYQNVYKKIKLCTKRHPTV